MRVLRVCRTHPRDGMPGAGLPAWYLAKTIVCPQLYVTKRLPGAMSPLPGHVRTLEVGFPEQGGLPETPGILRRGATAFGKLGSYSLFLMLSAPAISRFGPDVVHLHTPLPLPHAVWAKTVLGASVMLTFHGTGFVRARRSRLVRRAIRRWVDTICHVSPSMGEELGRLFPSKRILYTPNGVDLGEFPPGGADRERQVLAVGSLRWQKGYEYLLRAAARARQSRPDWRFVIVGEGPLRGELEADVERLGLRDTVRFVGARSHEEVSRLMRRSALFVLPSVTEGMPKVLLEAMACGTPVVTTKVSCCADVSRGAGLAVRSRDPKALARALCRLMENDRERQALGAAGPAIAARYSWSRTADLVRAEYEELLHARN